MYHRKAKIIKNMGLCTILPLGHDKQGTNIYKNIILYFCSSIVILIWCRKAIGESLCTQRSYQESELSVGTDFSQNSRPYIVLKLQCKLRAMLIFHWSLLTLMHCFLCINHSLHPCNSYVSLALVYSQAVLILHWSQLTAMHSLLQVIILLILSTAGFICQHHPPSSLQVMVRYYKWGYISQESKNNLHHGNGVICQRKGKMMFVMGMESYIL